MPSASQQSHATPSPSTPQKVMATPAFLYTTVLAMGAIGATLRYLLELLLPTNGFPGATLLINLIGCYIIYVVYQWFDRRVHIPHSIARGIGVGLVGAFTTLSAFCAESLSFLYSGDYLLFGIYLAATVFGTFIASLLGWATCSLLAYRRLKRLQHRRIEHHMAMQAASKSAAQLEGSTDELGANSPGTNEAHNASPNEDKTPEDDRGRS